VRLFLALWPSPEARMTALRWQTAQAWPADARLHAPANFHVTLPFIGAVAHAQVPALAAACSVPLTPFDLVLDHVEVWPRGIVVLAPTTVPDVLVELHSRLTDAVCAQGIELEPRAYRPHLTLARHASRLVPVEADLLPVRWRVIRYVLAVSAAGQYSVMQSYPARTADDASVAQA
jgi:2'-5' RNA ligase